MTLEDTKVNTFITFTGVYFQFQVILDIKKLNFLGKGLSLVSQVSSLQSFSDE